LAEILTKSRIAHLVDGHIDIQGRNIARRSLAGGHQGKASDWLKRWGKVGALRRADGVQEGPYQSIFLIHPERTVIKRAKFGRNPFKGIVQRKLKWAKSVINH
jgi:hypothetical protein